jgi:type II secretory ATPase GspE/PulE/Tfp pilus assembly ATPase PilB-like protein
MNLGGPLEELLGTAITNASFKRFIAGAYKLNVRYIHLDPQPDGFLVRIRGDKSLASAGTIEKSAAAPLLSFIKTAAGLKSHLSRLPDESSFTLGDFQVKVFSLPVIGGEKLVLKVTKLNEAIKSLSGLGFVKNDIKAIDKVLKTQRGLVLVLGENRQRVIFSMLAQLDARATSVSTVEHQKVLVLPLANQFIDETNYPETAPSALKIALRQGSHVIAVSRLDSPKLASLAIDACLDGRLVIAGLPVDDTFLVPDYLTYLGIPLFLLSSQLRLIVSVLGGTTNVIEVNDQFRDIFVPGLQPSEMRELYLSSKKADPKTGNSRKSVI